MPFEKHLTFPQAADTTLPFFARIPNCAFVLLLTVHYDVQCVAIMMSMLSIYIKTQERSKNYNVLKTIAGLNVVHVQCRSFTQHKTKGPNVQLIHWSKELLI